MATYNTYGVWRRTDATAVYLPWIRFDESAALVVQSLSMPPIDGAITFSVRITSNLAAGSTTLAVRRNRSGSDLATDVQTIPAGSPGALFTIATTGWTLGDELALFFTPTSQPDFASFHIQGDN